MRRIEFNPGLLMPVLTAASHFIAIARPTLHPHLIRKHDGIAPVERILDGN
jgi:hypothetical protein